jgi:hypothetical protein
LWSYLGSIRDRHFRLGKALGLPTTSTHSLFTVDFLLVRGTPDTNCIELLAGTRSQIVAWQFAELDNAI